MTKAYDESPADREDETAATGDEAVRLVGAHEIRLSLGLSRQRVGQITSRPDFPKPLAVLKSGKVWLADEVEGWLEVNRA